MIGAARHRGVLSAGHRWRELARRQEQDGRTVLLGRRRSGRAIDVPGPGESCVFIDSLPRAKRPTLSRTRETARRATGFEQYRLPRALVLLRQGVGRLVRARNDHGGWCVATRRAASYRASAVPGAPGLSGEVLPWSRQRVRLLRLLRERRDDEKRATAAAEAPRPSPGRSWPAGSVRTTNPSRGEKELLRARTHRRDQTPRHSPRARATRLRLLTKPRAPHVIQAADSSAWSPCRRRHTNTSFIRRSAAARRAEESPSLPRQRGQFA